MAGVGDGVENIGNGIATDTYGNIFITGNFTDTITFGDVPLVSAGEGDIFIVKYDVSGSPQWAVTGGGSQNEFLIRSQSMPVALMYMQQTNSNPVQFSSAG